MKTLLSIIAIYLVTGAVFAADPVTEAYLRGEEPKLNAKEWEAVKLARKWRNSDTSKPIKGQDGSIQYYHGVSQPTMVCSPLEVCVIKLQAGEVITTLHSGDNARWSITPVVVGATEGKIQTEVVVKPMEVGLKSSLYIGTARRSYHIKLLSSRTKFIPKMSFLYPQEFNQSWDKYQKMVSMKEERQTLASSPTQESRRIEELDFNYNISGSASWKPERVYNDGVRTIIQMPTTLHQSEAPVLLVLDEHDDEKLVNSRLKGHSFIVDEVFQQAILIAGVGKNQTRVRIERH